MNPGFFARLRKRRILTRIAGNSAWLLAEKLLRGGLGVVVSAIVARHLGPGAFGTLSIVIAYVMLFASAAGLGLGGVVIRELVREPSGRTAILGTAFVIQLCSAAAVFLAGNALIRASAFAPYDLPALVLVGSCALFFYAADVIDFQFQSELRGRGIFMARSAALAFSAGTKLIFVAVGAPLVFFAATPAIDAAVAAAMLFLIYLRADGGLRQWRFEPARAARLVRAALPMAVSGFLVIGIMQIDRIMLDRIVGAHAVGIYSAASLLSTAWYAVPVAIGASVAPALTGLFERNRDDYVRKLQDVFAAVTYLGLCVCVLVSLLSGPLVGLIFGDTYSSAALILTIHVWSGLFVAHVSIRSRALLIEGKLKFLLLFSGLTLVVNVALNFVLISHWAEVGAAVASLLSWALSALLFPLVSRHSRGFARMMLNSLVPATLAGALT